MRIDGFSSSSYPIKRAPRKALARDENIDEADAEIIDDTDAQISRASRRSENLPARQQDLIFPRGRDRRTASALASYLTTAGFTDWEMEVLGLDLYI
ncbi:hypothetical protein [Pseudomonas muyukensis]|uniref:Uncharacterized protein n=1 Tax=Pseudomonas muyukensis TaxID=2842357 RepID=A0ABX8M6S2_9PSED|nr:hypothetical protein [Pseudomonas muyukensis]QXH34776.1 hypothetical protein KSS95_21975 [Pseudomonas muyukensis]